MIPLNVPEDFHRRSLHVVRRGGPWHRFHGKDYSPLYFGKARKYRFDDPAGEYGVMYVAEDESGAFVETFLRDPELTLIDEEELRERRLSVIRTSDPMTLVDVTGEGLQHAGVAGDVSTAPHQEVQPLSRAIYEHPSKPDGIRYRLIAGCGSNASTTRARAPRCYALVSTLRSSAGQPVSKSKKLKC